MYGPIAWPAGTDTVTVFVTIEDGFSVNVPVSPDQTVEDPNRLGNNNWAFVNVPENPLAIRLILKVAWDPCMAEVILVPVISTIALTAETDKTARAINANNENRDVNFILCCNSAINRVFKDFYVKRTTLLCFVLDILCFKHKVYIV